jgi:hypothetical protein
MRQKNKQILDWLFKDVSFSDGVLKMVYLIVFFVTMHLFLHRINEQLISTYFEVFVSVGVFFTILSLFFVFSDKGYPLVSQLLVATGGIFSLAYPGNPYLLARFTSFGISILVLFYIFKLFVLGNLNKKEAKQNDKTN